MKSITAKELGMKAERPLMVDVRTPVEFEDVHIPGSRLVPLHTLEAAKAAELAKSGEPCVLVCRSGNRAKQAMEKLAAAGLSDLLVLEGGIKAWEEAGLEVNRGRKTISIERQVRIGAGCFVVAGVVLGVLLNPWFLVLSGFVGCGLIFAGLTDWCGMGLLLARMPWNNRSTGGQGGDSCCRGS